MKTRSGFVSNSSSSSFVLQVGKPFDTALEVAEHMIPQREWETDAALLEKVREIMTWNTGQPPAVCFRSCNYDTYIAKMGSYFLISTCHNHPWDLRSIEGPCPPEFDEYFGDEYFYELPRSLPFYHLEYDVVGRKADWQVCGTSYCSTPDCYTDLWIVQNKLVCPKCGTPAKKKKS